MDMKDIEAFLNPDKIKKHPLCKGYRYWTACGYEYDCGYKSELLCEECKYGLGRKDPEARCNQSSARYGGGA